ncbi:uncharacterized protein LOC109822250 isoform X2 [Asparagus officinalis]|uniref:uncharacterized protein LOC109822250 isoform X2 n=1 Tax=Asparagus officinalis TaxID=4686 RepID=UPI00098DE469|nr:uncharacterized protein LOC109822250 isoform X2 [Asparagus officinalis]
MAFTQFLLPVQSPASVATSLVPLFFISSPIKAQQSPHCSKKNPIPARAELQESGGNLAADAFANVKHVLLPITDRNPYLSEGTRQAAATSTALAKKYGADITVVVIDDKSKESIPEHEAQLSSIRWHLSEGGFKEFKLMEKLGEGKKPTAIIGEVADDLDLDLVVLSMEAIHSKHVDGNLLAEFIPCPVLLLPL